MGEHELRTTNGSPHPPRIATLCYVHLGFLFVLVAERSPAEGSVGQIFKCLKRLDDFHANPKRAGSVEKRRKGFGDPIWRFAESLRFACLRQNPRKPKENWALWRPSRQFAILCWRREWDSNPRYGFPYTRFPSVRLQPLGHLSHQPILRVQRICRPQDLPRSEHMKQRRKDTD